MATNTVGIKDNKWTIRNHVTECRVDLWLELVSCAVHIFFTASSNPTYSLTLCTLINISQYHKKSTISRQTSIWPVWDGVIHVP